jgi:periplasmic protein CpxP/Spy
MPDALDSRVDRPVDRRGVRQGRPGARRALAGAVLILSLGVAANGATAQTGNGPVQAQAQAPAAQKPGAAAKQAAPAGDPIEAQLGEIKKRLSITPAQQPQFEQFATIVKQNAQTMEALMQKATTQGAQRNAVEGLRTAASFAQTEADNLKRLVPALEELYASLSEQQKRAADQLFSSAPPSGAASPGEPKARPRG